ncbi:MAG: hypothetical protein H6Q73_3090 [Firmicutes bacterium]|nr:hypothetical protein [Bacillota bacterium]
MKNLLLRLLTGTVVLAFIFFYYYGSVDAAAITKTLDENTVLTPPGMIVANLTEFKKGTVVTLNGNGEVIEGTLLRNTSLPVVGAAQDYYVSLITQYRAYYILWPKVLEFKNETKVTFNNKGEVVKGTVAKGFGGGEVLFPLGQNSEILIKPFTEISFHENGMIATCTIAFAPLLRPVGWQQNLSAGYTKNIACPGFIQFQEETQVELNDKGEVIKGTLKNDTKLPSPDGSINVYSAGTMVEFNENGVVVKAVISKVKK